MDWASSLLAALDQLVLERRQDDRFAIVGEAPPWCRRLGFDLVAGEPVRIEDWMPFLEAFIPEAEAAWSRAAAGRVDSDCWTETATDGEELHFEAAALRVGDSAVLVITRNDALFEERRRVLQRARELRLAHDALAKEIERKDVLIHCIIHDLAGPLSSMLGSLSLLEEQPLAGKGAELVRVASAAALQQRELIREILDVFTAERSALDVAYDDFSVAPDLFAAVADVVEALAPFAAGRGVRLERSPEHGPPAPCRVIGEQRRLMRVLYNLVDNAIRFTPAGKRVRVLVEDERGSARVAVEDDGPGVPPSVVPHLFQKFGRGHGPGSGTGLGLYFCRITVEHWGGAIGYEARPEGGARFWFRLRRASAVATPDKQEARSRGVEALGRGR